jgi:membrane protein
MVMRGASTMDLRQDALPLLRETWEEFQNDEAGQLGAALAYYATFSIFPLLLLLLAGLGWVLSYWPVAINAQEQILAVASQNFSPKLGETIEQLLEVLKDRAGTATGIGLVTLLFGASGVFQQLDASFNKIWKAPKKTESSGIVATVTTVLREKLFSFGMVLSVGFLMLVSLALTGVSQALLGALQHIPIIGGLFGYLAGLLLTVSISTIVFALLFKYLPSTRVRWGDVWLGALLTAIIWEIAKRLLALYIEYTSRSFSAYGAIGTLLVLMIWVYFSSQVLFLGAEFAEVYSRRFGSRAPKPAPAPEPTPALTPPPVLPTLARAPARSTGVVAVATGAGLLIGALGTLIAAVVAVIIGVRRAIASVARRVTRG